MGKAVYNTGNTENHHGAAQSPAKERTKRYGSQKKLMERLKGAAALTEQDVGNFSHFKGKMMKISVTTMPVEDWGSLSPAGVPWHGRG